MKRPPGLWILLSAGVIWLSLQNADGLRATSLIFSKTTSTTTATPADEASTASETLDEETATEPSGDASSNTTKPPLTGDPQIDYIYDPNLPQELNGYNLSEYPFYERVPEDIDFKCDGLHDGFYASIPHKCQVYHHCLFGTRYDFLCANYTAFDQKTFICHFVSEVDCVNSKKFWHRNDALYKAASTTTIKPTFVYTPPSQPPPGLAAAPGQKPRPPAPNAAGGGILPRRPVKPRRPYADYYDYADYDEEYYDPPPRPRPRKRPRPRRPIYEDEYEEYEDDRYERRPRPSSRRGTKPRNKDRRYEDDLEEYDFIDTSENRRRNPDDEARRPYRRRNRYHGKRRPIDDDYDRPRKSSRRPVYDDDDDYGDVPADRRSTEKSRRGDIDDMPDEKVIKTTAGGSIYDRPRAAPRIKPPVPRSEANKFAYKPVVKGVPTKLEEDEEYYDDYEDDPPPSKYSRTTRKPALSQSSRSGSRDEPVESRKVAASSRHQTHSLRKPDYALDDEEEDRPRSNKNKGSRQRPRNGERGVSKRKRPALDDYYDDYEEVPKISKQDKSKFDDVAYEDESPLPKDKRTHKEERVSSKLGENKEQVASTEDKSSAKESSSSEGREEKPRREWRPSTPKERRPAAKYESSPKREETTHKNAAQSTELSANNEDSPEKQAREKNQRASSRERLYSRNKFDRTTTTTFAPNANESVQRDKPEHIVRIVKRPFLPSRGGNPYSARGLQPIGLKAKTETSDNLKPDENEEDGIAENENPLITQSSHLRPKHKNVETPENNKEQPEEEYIDKITDRPFKPSPIIVKVPIRKVILPLRDESKDENRPFTSRPQKEYEGPRTTQEPKIELPERNPLDIVNENEYDVTINDALNPTLPNLPVRGFPTGFSASDYTYSQFQRPRYQDPVLTQASSNEYNVYQQQKPVRQRFETLSFRNTNDEYKGQYSNLNSQVSQPQLHPRVIHHAQTQAYYTGY